LNIRKWDWTNSIDSTVLASRLSESTPTLLKIETINTTYNTVKSQNKITVGNKTYYQAGFTKNNYTLYTG
jgi:hypothetical protein